MKNFLPLLIVIFSTLHIIADDYTQHIIKKDETLWRIGKMYNVSVDELMTLNNIKDNTNIKIGMSLKIPQNKKNDYTNYTIKADETLWRISKRYGINIDQIIKLNNITDITKIKVGSIIKIPNQKNTQSIKTTTSKKTYSYKYHTLRKNETLWRVSKKYGVAVDTLCKINYITNTTHVKAGTKLKIPVSFEYLDYQLPAKGTVNLFNSSHFRGIHIFTGDDEKKRNITAVADGTVSYVDNVPGYGLTLFIRHANGYISTYSGLDEIYVKKDTLIKSNQIIGKAGNLSRYDKYGILFSIQYKGTGLKFDPGTGKFIKG